MGVRLSCWPNFDTADTVDQTTNATKLSQLSVRLAIRPQGKYSLEALPMSLSKPTGKNERLTNKQTKTKQKLFN